MTEHEISMPGQPGASMMTSSQVVNADQAADQATTAERARRARRDFDSHTGIADGGRFA